MNNVHILGTQWRTITGSKFVQCGNNSFFTNHKPVKANNFVQSLLNGVDLRRSMHSSFLSRKLCTPEGLLSCIVINWCSINSCCKNLRNGIPCSYTVALNPLSQGLPKTSKLWLQLKGTVENLNIERGVD